MDYVGEIGVEGGEDGFREAERCLGKVAWESDGFLEGVGRQSELAGLERACKTIEGVFGGVCADKAVDLTDVGVGEDRLANNQSEA